MMSGGTLHAIIEQVRRRIGAGGDGALSDASLLDRWLSQGDEAAFEVLLWRHGPMVIGVCRRLLAGEQDVEDAFQATFLALVRRASAISKRAAVGSWLYKVAYRACLRLREQTARQPARGRQGPELLAVSPSRDLLWHDLRSIVDEEVQRLPARYRAAFVLCHLEGMTNEEAARALGCPTGTVVSRLSRARERLRRRLTRRGVTLAGAALAAPLGGEAPGAALPGLLVKKVTKAAMLTAAGKAAPAGLVSAQVTALTEGVLRAMLFTKVKVATIVVLAGIALGASLLAYRGQAGADTVVAQEGRPAQRTQVPERSAEASMPARLARLKLEEAEKELLQAHSELRRKKIELERLKHKDPTAAISAGAVRKLVDEDKIVILLLSHVATSEHGLERVDKGHAAEAARELESLRSALARRRSLVEDRVQEQLHQKAREEWRSELSQLQERIGFLGDLEKVLTAELERLSKETAAGPRSVEERLRDLENEVRRLKMALDKK